MRRAVLVIIAIALLFLCPVAVAADWAIFVKDSQGCPQFYDTKSISKKGRLIKVWTKISADGYSACKEALSSPEEVEEHKAQEMRTLIEINCATKAFRMLATKVYASGGLLLVDSKDSKAKFEPITQNTVAERLAHTVCK
ncbi:MAG: surface-adhesin E family protein [Dissulfurispiraceae bacterium]